MIKIGQQDLSLGLIDKIISDNEPIEICSKKMQKLELLYEHIKIKAQDPNPIYGINTGFGALAESRVDLQNQEILQKNIIISHAVGFGEALDFKTAKTIMLLRLNTLAQGYSGASPLLITTLCDLINHNCSPLIPRKGSVGASGDLAPLAHLGLLLLGIGEGFLSGIQTCAKKILAHANIDPLKFGVRDGLALINGTQAMSACAVQAILQSQYLAQISDICAASSLEALGGHHEAFDPRIHELKSHPGQITSAQNIRMLIKKPDTNNYFINSLTQDPYSLRCAPQVHGASHDIIAHVTQVCEREINAITDNPLIFTNLDLDRLEVLSGGNFHGQAIAFALDYLAMALSEYGAISERRLELLLNPVHNHGLPAFLTPNGGINSGYMMLHTTASALVAENKILCSPASIDSIPTSANREDHVSMGMNSANKLDIIIQNTWIVLAIELLAAHQALSLRDNPKTDSGISQINYQIRQHVPARLKDTLFKKDVEAILGWLKKSDTKKFLENLL